MRLFHVGCRVEDPASSKAAVVRRLLVDTGAESTWIDAKVLESIGIERRKKDPQFQLANGQVITRSLGYAALRVEKSETVDEVVFAGKGDLQLLGARARGLESKRRSSPEEARRGGADRERNGPRLRAEDLGQSRHA